MLDENEMYPMKDRFRGFLPIVIDIETSGFNKETNAVLEIAAVILRMDEKGDISRHRTYNWHVTPFEGSVIDAKSMDVNKISLDSPFRQQIAISEHKAMADFFKAARKEIKANFCTRAILVGHNAPFDLGFVNAAAERAGHKRNPFHPFSTFDTVSLGALAYGQTVLARIVEAAQLGWDSSQAHSAMYDAEKTADIFCIILNKWNHYQLSMDLNSEIFTEK